MWKKIHVYLFLIAAMLCWGYSFIWYKQAYPSFEPVTIIFFRLLISVPLIIVFALFTGRMKWPRRSDLKYFLLLAFFEPFLYFLGEANGVQYISSTLAAILVATIPLFTPFIGYYFYHERLTSNNYLGLAISFAGVVMVVYIEGQLGEVSLKGVLLMFMAVASTLAYGAVLRKVADRYTAISIVGIQNLIGALYFLPLFLIMDAGSFSMKGLSLRDWEPVIYLSVFGSAVAFISFVQGIKVLGISKATVFANFIPVITAVIAVMTGMELLNLQKAAGILITILGLFMAQASGTNRIRVLSRIQK